MIHEDDAIKVRNLILLLVMTAAIAMGTAACGSEPPVQIANPWVDCNSLAEAVKNAGFTMEAPESIEGYGVTAYQNCQDEIIQVVYLESEGSDKEIVVRKGKVDNIAGDYNDYAKSSETTVGAYKVTIKGNDDTVSLATWTADGYNYSVSVPQMSADEVISIIEQIK